MQAVTLPCETSVVIPEKLFAGRIGNGRITTRRAASSSPAGTGRPPGSSLPSAKSARSTDDALLILRPLDTLRCTKPALRTPRLAVRTRIRDTGFELRLTERAAVHRLFGVASVTHLKAEQGPASRYSEVLRSPRPRLPCSAVLPLKSSVFAAITRPCQDP
jgi:hypothetical protein